MVTDWGYKNIFSVFILINFCAINSWQLCTSTQIHNWDLMVRNNKRKKKTKRYFSLSISPAAREHPQLEVLHQGIHEPPLPTEFQEKWQNKKSKTDWTVNLLLAINKHRDFLPHRCHFIGENQIRKQNQYGQSVLEEPYCKIVASLIQNCHHYAQAKEEVFVDKSAHSKLHGYYNSELFLCSQQTMKFITNIPCWMLAGILLRIIYTSTIMLANLIEGIIHTEWYSLKQDEELKEES